MLRSCICLVFLATSFAHAAVPLSVVKKATNLPAISNRFIVEVNTTIVPDALSGGEKTKRALHSFLHGTLSKNVDLSVDKQFSSPGLFVGAAVTLTDPSSAADIANMEGVIAIRPLKAISRPNPVKSHVVTGPNDPAITPDTQNSHVLTGVDKLHAQGIFGAGVQIGILDTGVDYTNPVLGGAFGPGNKVAGGTDLVGDAYDGSNTPQPDPDPLDQCAGHGTHVTGIIGANPNNDFNISGVAFESTIFMYRIFGCTGFVTDDVIIDALLMGIADGNDILTLSLGGADGWTESTSSVVASRIAASGKVVTIAAGNDGDVGAWYTSSPGNGIDVISVASLDSTTIPLQNATVHGVVHDPITYFDTFRLDINGSLPIFATSNDTTVADDACDPLPDDTPDLSPFLVVVRRGTCSFVQKLTNIAAKGGNVSFIYDNGMGFADIDVGNFTAVLIQAADGEFLVSEFASGAKVTVSFPENGATQFVDPTGGLISSFTSYGPTNDFHFKPAVAAPGGNILSTFPVPLGSFAVLSGTSMATPFVAGVSALLFSVKGTTSAVGRGARTLFETTAQAVASSHTDGDPLQTITQQGAGLINAFDAIHSNFVVSPGEFILNDSAHFQQDQTFTVTNNGRTAQKFTISHVPAGTAVTVNPGTIFVADGPVPLSTAAATVKFSTTSFTVNAGKTETVHVRFSPPAGADATTFPVFSGFIEIASASGSFHVSYIGLAAALRDKQVVDDTDEFFGVTIPLIMDTAGDVQEGPENYTFTADDFPTLLFRLAFGTALLRVDLVDPNIQINTTLAKRDSDLSPGFTFPHPSKGGSFAQVKILGALMEQDFIPRNSDDPSNNGFYTIAFEQAVFSNGTAIPNGSFRFLLRVLKVTGNPTNENDFESWLSPIIGVNASD